MIRLLSIILLAATWQLQGEEDSLPRCFDWDAEPSLHAGKKVAVVGYIDSSWLDEARKEESGTVVVIRQFHPASLRRSKYLVLKLPFQILPGSTDFVQFRIIGKMTVNDSAVPVANNLGTISEISGFEFGGLTAEIKEDVIDRLRVGGPEEKGGTDAPADSRNEGGSR